MRKPANYEETQAYTGESRQLPAGLYVCQIVMAIEEERNGSRILAVAFDIAEGEYKGFYKQRYDANTDENKKWPAIHRQFVEDREGSCNPFFKGLITSIEESNPNFKWNWEESTLKGKKFGAIMGREEFLTNDGQKKMATKLCDSCMHYAPKYYFCEKLCIKVGRNLVEYCKHYKQRKRTGDDK